MNRLRVISTVSNDLTHDQRMQRICSSLARNGYEVLLVGRALQESKPLIPSSFSQKRLPLFFNKGKLFYLELNVRLFLFLLFAKFDIVYSVDLDTIAPARSVSFLRRKTCVFDAHEYFTEVPELVGRPISKWFWEVLAKTTIPNLKHCITVCESLADVFFKKYRTRFEVIRNVPFHTEPAEASKVDWQSFVLLYQGVLNDGRGLEESIEALVYLPEDVHLWLAGEGDLSDSLRKLVVKHGLEQRVKFFGKLPPAELALLTPKAHLGLNLLKNKGLNYYYSLANKAFDYIQAGIPSIGMAFPEYEKLNKDFGVFQLIDSLEPQLIANAIQKLRLDQQLYDSMAANCHKAAKVLNWENEEIRLVQFFEKIAVLIKSSKLLH